MTNDNKEGPLWTYDLVHRGQLFKHIREQRGITQEKMARLSHAGRSTIARFEKGELPGQVGEYLKALQSEELDYPLSPDEAAIVGDLYRSGDPEKSKEKQEELSWVRLADPYAVNSSDGNKAILAYIEQIAKLDQPAFVVDPTSCVHALNGASLRLFNIDPQLDIAHLKKRDFWNYFTCKMYRDSPFYAAHVETKKYYTQAITNLFRDPFIRPYWFTAQMRVLVQYLYTITKVGGFRFASAWQEATSFSYDDNGGRVNRALTYVFTDGRRERIYADAYELFPPEDIEVGEGIQVPFRIGIWKPEKGISEEAFADISRSDIARTIYYTSTYDTDENFHLNTWPELEKYLNRPEKE